MSTEFSSLAGHRFAPGEEEAKPDAFQEIMLLLAPHALVIAGLSLLAIFWIVWRGAARRRKAAEAAKAEQAPKELTPEERARIAERKRLRAEFDARQEASARARAEIRAKHFGDVSA